MEDGVEGQRRGSGWRSRRVIVPAAVLAGAGVALALAVFQPWRLFVDEVVWEALPAASASASPSQDQGPAASSPPAPRPTSSEPVEIARGELISHEHATTGTVRLLRLADGTRVIRVEGLDTSSGPDLRVWLSDQPVIDGTDGWRVFDDGDYLDLGGLKGNKGDQNYVVPAGADIDGLTSVSIWCARFAVSFGAADLVEA